MLAAGTTLGPYKILAPLGAGGMGEVYRVRDTRLGRDVALKVIHAEVARDPDRIKRFEQEARAAGALSHPNVCAIYDIGTHEGSPFVVMELLEGESLRDKLRTGAIPARKAIDYAAQAAHGLAAAHEKGIIHRDLKPENLFVTKDGRVKVLDFGLAKLTRPDMVVISGEPTISIAATETGAILGTAGYMSPEQVRGESADARSDLFALGAILYEMLSGKRAFHEESVVDTLSAILHREPAPLSTSGHDIPGALEPVFRRCLEKSPDERFQNARDLAFALESIGSGQVQPQGAPTAVAGPRHRRRFVWAVTVAVIALVGVGVGAWLAKGPLARWQRGQHAAQPTTKEWILVAEFEGPRDDPDLARAAQGLVATALDQSGIVMTVPRDQLGRALDQAGRPDTLRVDAKLARELAYRNGIRAVLEGRVSRVGSGYTASLRLSDSSNDSTLITVDGTARNQDDLIPALDRLARRMRRELGENPAAVRATRSLNIIITPSFAAYRKVEQGGSYWGETGDPIGEIRFYREALELDPDCAWADLLLATCFSNMGKPDSAAWACEEALKRAGRLTEEQRLFAEATLAFQRGDLDGALQGLNRQLQLFPTGPASGLAYNLRWVIDTWSRRLPQALEDARHGSEAEAFGPGQSRLSYQVLAEITAGQLDQAQKTLARLHGHWWHRYAVSLAVARDDWAKAESLCAHPAADVASQPNVRNQAAWMQIVLHARRGEVHAAQEELASALRAPQLQASGGVLLKDALLLPMVSGTRAEFLKSALDADTATVSIINRCWYAALAGDLSVARHELAVLRRRSPDDLSRAGAAQDFLEALIAATEARWIEAIRFLGPVALRGDDRGSSRWGRIGVVPERWLVAEAWNQLGPPDSAAAAFERVLEPPESRAINFFVPYAYQRLVMIYARMGRREDAERHWQAFSKVFINPDPEVKHLLDDARAAIQGLRGMARPERPRT